MNKLKNFILINFIFLGLVTFSQADEITREQIKGLDEQVQDIKKDVLGISTELMQLEEKLLYPSNTQVSVFVSFEKGSKFRLDAVNLKLDGKDVSHHLYTFKELDALQSGGVQRIYTGNVKAGEHIIDVNTIVKVTGSGSEQKNSSYKFVKAIEPKLVEIHLTGTGSSNERIDFKE